MSFYLIRHDAQGWSFYKSDTNQMGVLQLHRIIPYRGKHWRGKTLVNLANDHKFAKV